MPHLVLHGHCGCRTLFIAAPHVAQCVVPIACNATAASAWAAAPWATLFKPCSRRSGAPEEEVALFLCPREHVLAPASVRCALEEDYDDLMPIFEKQSTNIEQR
jgi:hypothetical protein